MKKKVRLSFDKAEVKEIIEALRQTGDWFQENTDRFQDPEGESAMKWHEKGRRMRMLALRLEGRIVK